MRDMLRTRSGFKNIFKKIFRRPRGGPTALDVTPLEQKRPLKAQHATPRTLASLHDPLASLHDPSASLHDPSASHPLPDQKRIAHSDVLEAGQYEPIGHRLSSARADPLADQQAVSKDSSKPSQDTEELAPKEITCTLEVTYGDTIVDRLEGRKVKWQDQDTYDILNAAAVKCLSHYSRAASKQFYLKSGRCRLIRHDSNKEAASEILETREQWSESLPLMIMTFCSQNPYVKFHLEVQWEYSGLQIERVDGQNYAVTIANVVHEKMKKNWEDKSFVPRKDLDEIFTRATVAALITEDSSLHDDAFLSTNGRPLDEASFIEDVHAVASRLLAICVYADLPLICLYKLRQQKVEDIKLPLTGISCPVASYSHKFQIAMTIQGMFIAHEFRLNNKRRPEHQQLDQAVVVPILFDQSDDSEDRIGQGSFGKVFKVRIDSSHHAFPPTRDGLFALKIFFEQGSRTRDDFNRESRALKKMAENPHPHITPHLASWTQNGKFYMLFPLAEQNLQTFMAERPHPPLTKENILFILTQMKGLADGVRRIHILAPSGLGPHTLNRSLSVAAQKQGSTGFHHDLKPANILVFLSPGIGGFSFSISDFGSARIGSILSGSNPNPNPKTYTKTLSPGDVEYAAPDSEIVKKTGRPYDMWSLGCIFLEMLIWTLGLGEDSLADFSIKRLGPPDHRGNEDGAFWYKDVDGVPRHKQAVEDQIAMLTNHCRKRGIFEDLIATIVKLLTINPSNRIDAPALHNALDAILIQAEHDLEIDENFYLQEDQLEQDKMAAPPTSFQDDQGRGSGTPSIDGGSIDGGSIDGGSIDGGSIDGRQLESSHGIYLAVETKAPRRATISNGYVTGSPIRQQFAHARQTSLPNGEINSERQRLAPVSTQSLLPADELSRSPSISVSEYDDQDPLREVGGQEELHQTVPTGYHSLNIRQEDIYRSLRRRTSRDSQSI
jgi:serine/threonine protein kinase